MLTHDPWPTAVCKKAFSPQTLHLSSVPLIQAQPFVVMSDALHPAIWGHRIRTRSGLRFIHNRKHGILHPSAAFWHQKVRFVSAIKNIYLCQWHCISPRNNQVLNLVISYIINSGGLNLYDVPSWYAWLSDLHATTARFFATACLITVSSRSGASPHSRWPSTQYVIYPKTLVYAPFFFILIRLYPCSFLTMYVDLHSIARRISYCEDQTQFARESAFEIWR